MASILNATTSSGLVTSADNSGSLQLATNNGTTAVTIDTSQKVGVGTTSPTGKLHVYGSGEVQTLQRNSGSANNYTLFKTESGADQAYLGFSDGGVNDFAIYNVQNGYVRIATNNTERMRIESSGNINFNSTVYANTTVNAANMFLNSGPIHQIYRSTSSIKYKKDVETIEDSYSNALLQCRPVWFKSLCSGDNKDYGYWGFIAEEVAEIDPRLVFWTTSETVQNENGESITVNLEKPIAEGVQYDRFVPHLLNLIKKQNETSNTLTAAIQELKAELDATKAEVQALKGVA